MQFVPSFPVAVGNVKFIKGWREVVDDLLCIWDDFPKMCIYVQLENHTPQIQDIKIIIYMKHLLNDTNSPCLRWKQ